MLCDKITNEKSKMLFRNKSRETKETKADKRGPTLRREKQTGYEHFL